MPDVFLLTTAAATTAAAVALLHARHERRRADAARLDRRHYLDHEKRMLEAVRRADWRPYFTADQIYPPEPPLDGRRAAILWRTNKKTNTAKDIKALKYRKLTLRQATAHAAALARHLERQYTLADWPVSLITSTPGDPARTDARGFNPADLLAAELARRVHLPYRPLIFRTRQTASQVEAATGSARRANLVDAFAALPCSGTVLVVDDVATTGATLIECARALKAAGADRVYALTIAGGYARSIPHTRR